MIRNASIEQVHTHTFTVRSSLPETTRSPAAVKATELTDLKWRTRQVTLVSCLLMSLSVATASILLNFFLTFVRLLLGIYTPR